MGRAKTIGVAQIGHKFIGKAHAYAYSERRGNSI